MKKLSIQWWLAGALGLLFIIPACVAVIAIQYQLQAVSHWSSTSALQSDVMAHLDRWRDATWQRALTAELQGSAENIVLLDATGRIVYSNALHPLASTAGQSISIQHPQITMYNGEVMTVEKDQRLLGMMIIYMPPDYIPFDGRVIIMVEIMFSSLLVLAILAYFLRLTVVKPLVAMNKAARMIANNDLDIHLPRTPIGEIAQVIDTLTTMSAALRAAIYRQAELEQERKLFISAIAHDLRTPLFSLRGYLEAMQTGIARSTEQVTKYLSLSQKKAETLERLIGDLFAYAQLEYLAISPQQEQVELGLLLRRIVDGLQPQSNTRGIHLLTEGQADPCLFLGDEYLLTRAVENMLDNALRYTPMDGTITVRWFRYWERAYFTITDTGPGIAPEALDHVFTPLYRGEASRNRQTGGAGLGLTIAKCILVAHGGDLTASNAPLKGAQFTGWLPIYMQSSFKKRSR